MQRPATKKSTRAANAYEKRFMAWVKQQPCIECGFEWVIVDHMYGSAFIHNKELVGHVAILPLCDNCDRVKTFGSHREYKRVFGHTQAHAFMKMLKRVPVELMPPQVKIDAIVDWGR